MEAVGFLTFDRWGLLGLFGPVAVLEDVVDELVHALLALETGALDALEALGVGLLPEHFLFIG
jgi:hypothetical protein